jgi:predicted ATP-grasp superfamily ATP-dependent carboligase
MGRAVATTLGLKGPFKIDMIRDGKTGEFFTLEINARFNLWHYLGAVGGVNLPAIAYHYLVAKNPCAQPRVRAPSRRWIHTYRDLQAYREHRAHGELGVMQWIRSILSVRNVHDVFAWRDPAPFVRWLRNFISGKVEHGALRNRLGYSR